MVPPKPLLSSTGRVPYQDTIGSPSRSEKFVNRVLSQSTRVHILRDKFEEEEIIPLEQLAYSLGAQVTSCPDPANVIVTCLKAPKRIAKHVIDYHHEGLSSKIINSSSNDTKIDEVHGELGKGKDWSKFVVKPEWLDAVKEAGTLVDPDDYPAVPPPPANLERAEASSSSSSPSKFSTGSKRERSSSPSSSSSSTDSSDTNKRKRGTHANIEPALPEESDLQAERWGSGPEEEYPKQRRVPPWNNTRYACRRPSPLKCLNQALVDELEVIRNERRLTGDTYSEMAYMRAISALKAYPYLIPMPSITPGFDADLLSARLNEVESLKGVGKKVFSLIKQFYSFPNSSSGDHGNQHAKTKSGSPYVIEAKVIRRDRAIYIMNAFTELYGIGPIGAREAYNSGARSFADVLARGKSLATHLTAKESLRILPELRQPIPRVECEDLAKVIMDLVRDLLSDGKEGKGAREDVVKYQICGGYRRGKPYTYDLDVIIGHSENPCRALHERLLREMQKKGLVTHIVNITTPASAGESYSDTNSSVDQAESGDSSSSGSIHVDVANIVVLPPITKNNPNPIHRRVDLIFAPLKVYGATVLGWTGSMTFERDLRLWARNKGYSFSFDGLTNLAEECVMDTPTEEGIFKLLELEWMPPEYRNCDA